MKVLPVSSEEGKALGDSTCIKIAKKMLLDRYVENKDIMSFFTLGVMEIGYPGNESGEVDTMIRNLLTNKAVAFFLRPQILAMADKILIDQGKDIKSIDYFSVFLGDDTNNQLIFRKGTWNESEAVKKIAKGVIDLFNLGPAKWGLMTTPDKGCIGIGKSEYIKIMAQRGKILPNNILDPFENEKSPTINFDIQMKLASLSDTCRLMGFRGCNIRRVILYMTAMFPLSLKMIFGSLKAIPSVKVWRYTGLSYVLPTLNKKLFTRLLEDEKYETLVMSGHGQVAMNKAFHSVFKAFKGNDRFEKSSEMIGRSFITKGVAPKGLEMYSRENILRLQLAKAVEPKITALDRDQNEAQSLGRLYFEAKNRSENTKKVSVGKNRGWSN